MAVDPNLVLYESAENLCARCLCTDDINDTGEFKLDCSKKEFKNMIVGWPKEFKEATASKRLEAIFSGSKFDKLQPLPPTDDAVQLTCRHCGIMEITSAVFIDTPNIIWLDLAYNKITSDSLKSDTFRGRFNDNEYDPIKLDTLDLSNNAIHSLDDKLFVHTPYMTVLSLSYNPLNVLDMTTVVALSSLTKLTVC